MKEELLLNKKCANIGISRKYFDVSESSIISDSDKIIEVKFASFGNRDSDGDILIKGCFSKSINERGPRSSTNRKIAFLWQHDMNDPIGRIIDMEEKEDGAYALVKLSDFDAVPNSKRAYYQLKDGTLNQFSFGFNYIWDKIDFDEESESWIVKEVKMFEASVVTLGANENTEFLGFVQDEKMLKMYLNGIKSVNEEKYKRLINIILDQSREAEPQTALTLGKGLFDSIGSKIKI